ncbi:hypothetical protein BUALT_Bualt13G0038300 [Buddleja alternifolia]|uniref:Uncharacterized protein n=1 Tax=Buddleja alternifolia TaxID=168488 RepID=A0AAV6WTN1_9LAMI|nr:hypothetical protein BUALT_Bualt13G0038300 [Buddleja alternifolia]
MLHLRHYTYLPLQNTTSFSSINNHKNSIFLYGFNKISRRNGNLGSLNGVEKDSDFEVDPDKAREALRKLDEQLQSISNKQVNSPKVRASDVNQSRRMENEGSSIFSGSFLTYVASGLLVFTILYNVIFLTVIKPSVDGPDQTPSADARDGSPLRQLLSGRVFPDGQ